MMCVTGPGLRAAVTAAAVAALGTPVLPGLWRVIEAHGTARTSEHQIGDTTVRVIADGEGGVVVGGVGVDFKVEAA